MLLGDQLHHFLHSLCRRGDVVSLEVALFQRLHHLRTSLVVPLLRVCIHGSFSFLITLLQPPGLIGQRQRIDEGIQVAVDDGGEVEIFTVPREAVVRHTVLGEIIGTYLAAAVTGPHLTAPGGGDLGLLRRIFMARSLFLYWLRSS